MANTGKAKSTAKPRVETVDEKVEDSAVKVEAVAEVSDKKQSKDKIATDHLIQTSTMSRFDEVEVKETEKGSKGGAMRYTRDQWLTIAAAVAFLIGGVFMLVNVFGGQEWAFFVGLGIAVAATILMILGWLDNRRRVAANLVATAPQNDSGGDSN